MVREDELTTEQKLAAQQEQIDDLQRQLAHLARVLKNVAARHGYPVSIPVKGNDDDSAH